MKDVIQPAAHAAAKPAAKIGVKNCPAAKSVYAKAPNLYVPYAKPIPTRVDRISLMGSIPH